MSKVCLTGLFMLLMALTLLLRGQVHAAPETPDDTETAAAVIAVNSTDDLAITSDGACTLREAINNANANSDTTGGDCTAGTATADRITFTLTCEDICTITLNSTLPNILGSPAGALSIVGGTYYDFEVYPNIQLLGKPNVRIFSVAPNATLTLRNLSLSGGQAAQGGAILNQGRLSLIDSRLSGNRATADGGAIYNDGNGRLSVTRVFFRDNGAGGRGGAIANYGVASIANSQFSSNTSINEGGALFQAATTGITITESVFAFNRSNGHGGGIQLWANSTALVQRTLFLINSAANGDAIATVPGSKLMVENSVADGDIHNQGVATIINVTFKAPLINLSGATMTVKNSILKVTTGATCENYGTFTGSNNLSQDNTCTGAGGSLGSLGPVINLSTLIELQPNGDWLPLDPDSNAIDAAPTCNGANGQPLATDSRGMARPQGSACDIGAYERHVRIVLREDAQPDSTTNFRFTSTLGNFILDNPATNDGDSYSAAVAFDQPIAVHSVTQQVPTGWFLTNIICNDPVHTLVDLPNRRLTIKDLNPNVDRVDCTFVNERAVNIYTRVFDDRNGNGVRNSTEPFLSNWTVKLYNSSNTLAATLVTSSDGKADFRNLRAGSYTVCEELQSGWTNTVPSTRNPLFGNQPCYTTTLTPGQFASLRFGNRQALTSADAAPITSDAGFTIGASPDIDADSYGYEGMPPADPLLEDDAPIDEQEANEQREFLYLPLITH